jgi:hypothetical protein
VKANSLDDLDATRRNQRDLFAFFLLDWPTRFAAIQNDRGRLPPNVGSAPAATTRITFRIINTFFVCLHPDFVVQDAPNANTLDGTAGRSPEMNKPNWFDTNVRTKQEFGRLSSRSMAQKP